ncbi:MAG: hypothetical protein NTY38_04715, partial [Acidobacteria bacterium]|nr:hypothetical protein [Acidobacteriota bacterium]
TPVAAVTTVTITAAYAGVNKTSTLTVNPVAVASVSISPASVVGGVSATGNRVTLNGPAPAGGVSVPVTSSVPGAATAPATVPVAAGATFATFTITTSAVSVSTPVTISASFGGATVTGTLTVRPAALTSNSISPATVGGGASAASNRVYLDGPAGPGGAIVTLSSSNPAAVTAPASVTVLAGATSSPVYTLTTSAVSVLTPVTITATYLGISKTGILTVNPTALLSISLSPSTLAGGLAGASNRVTLDSAAAPAGAVVPLTSSNPAVAAVPASVTVAAGTTVSPYFSITTSNVAVATPVTISGVFGGVTRTAILNVVPAALSLLSLNPATVVGPLATATNRVILTGRGGGAASFGDRAGGSNHVTLLHDYHHRGCRQHAGDHQRQLRAGNQDCRVDSASGGAEFPAAVPAFGSRRRFEYRKPNLPGRPGAGGWSGSDTLLVVSRIGHRAGVGDRARRSHLFRGFHHPDDRGGCFDAGDNHGQL